MRRLSWVLAACLLQAPAWSTVVTKDILPNRTALAFSDMFRDGDYNLDFKAHVEDARQNNHPHGHANTLAMRLGYHTPYYQHIAALFEFQHVSAYGNAAFNPGQGIRPGKANRPVIGDPQATALTQGYMQYNGFRDTVVRLGRQRIELDDERWISSDSFRQTPQSFDAFSFDNHSHPKLQVFYAYIGQVNSIYQGSEASGAMRKHRSHLFNFTWKEDPWGALVAYTYLLDDRQNASNSTRTYGLRWEGHLPFDDVTLHYVAEGARQYDGYNNPSVYHADYHMAGLGVDFTYLTLWGNYQSLGGKQFEADKYLRTPLGSTHDFLGWAEAFSTIPQTGIKDYKITASSYVYDVSLEASYHHFHRKAWHGFLGYEWDLGVQKSFLESYSIGLGYAHFKTRTSGLDNIQRWWALLSVHFS